MRWFVRLAIVAVLAWGAYHAPPAFALRRLAAAVQARDAAAAEAEVDLRAVRLSLSQQIISTHLTLTGQDKRLGSLGRNLAVAAGSSLVDPIVARFATPEALVDLLGRGRLRDAPGRDAAPAALLDGLAGLRLADAWLLYLASGFRSPREFVLELPLHGAPEDRFALRLRLADWRWRLSGIGLPAALRRSLAEELARNLARS